MQRHIAKTLSSATGQTFQSLEILVVDDCSDDETPDIVQTMAKQDQRIRYFRLAENSNLPAVPRNVGISQSRGEFVAFLDSDDTWTAGKLERQVALLRRHPETAMAHAPMWVQAYGSRVRGITRLPRVTDWRPTYASLLKRNSIMCSSVIVRKESLLQLGGFNEDPRLRAVEDYELWLRVATIGKVRFQPFICGSYLLGEAGTSGQERGNQRLHELAKVTGMQIRTSAGNPRAELAAGLLNAPLALSLMAAYAATTKPRI